MISLPMTLSQSAVAILCTTLGILVLLIAYRFLLRYLGKGKSVDVKYINLYPILSDSVAGEITLFYEAEEKKEVTMNLLDKNWNHLRELDKRLCGIGGNKVVFDTREVENGVYFYQLMTDNQTVSKRFVVENPG